MPIGPVVPGSPTTVTPDTGGLVYASVQVPSPTELVQADDVAELALETLNFCEFLLERQHLVTENNKGESGTVGSTYAFTGTSDAALSGSHGNINITNLKVGDIIHVTAAVTVAMNGPSTGGGFLSLYFTDQGASATQVATTETVVNINGGVTTIYEGRTLVGRWTVQQNGTTNVSIRGRVASGGDSLTITPGYSMNVVVYRTGSE